MPRISKKTKNPHRVFLSTHVALICANLAVGNVEIAKESARKVVAYLRKLGLVD